MNQFFTFYVQDFMRAIEFYSHQFQIAPAYIDSIWAVYDVAGVKFTLVNSSLIKIFESEKNGNSVSFESLSPVTLMRSKEEEDAVFDLITLLDSIPQERFLLH